MSGRPGTAGAGGGAEQGDEPLAAQVEQAVLAVPGVTAVFRAASRTGGGAAAVRSALGRHEPPVHVHEQDGVAWIAVTIGVEAPAGAPATAAAVRAAVAGLLPPGASRITVRVASIDPFGPAGARAG